MYVGVLSVLVLESRPEFFSCSLGYFRSFECLHVRCCPWDEGSDFECMCLGALRVLVFEFGLFFGVAGVF